MALTTLGSDLLRVLGTEEYLYLFSDGGVDIYKKSDLSDNSSPVAYAALSSVTCGTINDNGVYLGTSTAGIYKLPLTSLSGNVTGDLVQTYTTSSTPAVANNAITDIDGRGTALLITSDDDVDFLPDASTVYTMAAGTDVGKCAIGVSKIAYQVSGLVDAPSSGFNVNDEFTGSDSDAPNSLLWTLTGPENAGSSVNIQSNKLSFVADASPSVLEGMVLETTYNVSGDFDAEFDFSDFTTNVTDDTSLMLLFVVDADNYCLMRVVDSTSLPDAFRFFGKVGGSTTSVVDTNRSNDYGKLRLIRFGGVIYGYYTDGAGSSTLLGSDTLPTSAGSLKIYFSSSIASAGASAKVDNFKVNVGKVEVLDRPTANWSEGDGYSVAEGRLDDDFVGDDGDAPRSDIWTPSSTTNVDVSIQNNKLRFNRTGTISSNEYPNAKTAAIAGDCVIDIDFSGADLAVNNSYIGFSIATSDDNSKLYAQVKFHSSYGDEIFECLKKDSGSYTSVANVARTNSFGKLRLTRSGTTLQMFYVDGAGSSFTQLGSDVTLSEFEGDEDLIISLDGAYYTGETGYGGCLDNLKFVSGGVSSGFGRFTPGTLNALRFGAGNKLFAGHEDGIDYYDDLVWRDLLGSSDIGTVVDVQDVCPLTRNGRPPVAHYTMDNISGSTLIDEMGNYDGTISGATQTTGSGGKYGEALEFDTSDDYVSIPAGVISGSEFTIALWVYVSSTRTTQDGYFFSDSADAPNLFCRAYNSDAEYSFGIGDITAPAGVNPSSVLDAWCFLLLSHDADGNTEFFIDDMVAPALSLAGSNFTGLTSALYLGNRSTLDRDFEGKMDQVRIYDCVLSKEERLALLDDTCPGPITNRVAYATSDGAEGGQAGIFNLTADTDEFTAVSGDAEKVWASDHASVLVYDLESYQNPYYEAPMQTAEFEAAMVEISFALSAPMHTVFFDAREQITADFALEAPMATADFLVGTQNFEFDIEAPMAVADFYARTKGLCFDLTAPMAEAVLELKNTELAEFSLVVPMGRAAFTLRQDNNTRLIASVPMAEVSFSFLTGKNVSMECVAPMAEAAFEFSQNHTLEIEIIAPFPTVKISAGYGERFDNQILRYGR